MLSSSSISIDEICNLYSIWIGYLNLTLGFHIFNDERYNFSIKNDTLTYFINEMSHEK